MIKKIIITIAIIAIVTFAGFFLFLLLSGQSPKASTYLNKVIEIFPTGQNRLVGNSSSTTVTTASTTTNITTANLTPDFIKSLFTQLTLNPIAGYDILDNKNGSTSVFYLDKDSGNLNEINNQGTIMRLSNETLPYSYNSTWLFLPQQVSVLVDSLNGSAESFSLIKASLNGSSTDAVSVTAIDQKYLSPVSSPDKSRLAYLEVLSKGVSLFLNDFVKNKQLIFSSSYNEWTLSWPNNNLITFQTKAATGQPGFLYFFNLKTKSFQKILGNIPSLETLVSPDGTKVFYSTYTNSLSTFLYDLKTKTSQKLELNTLPEKCAWSADSVNIYCAVPQTLPAANYPDDWYQGKIIFNDKLFVINILSGANSYLPLPSGKNYDFRHLKINRLQKALYLEDQNNLLYKYSL